MGAGITIQGGDSNLPSGDVTYVNQSHLFKALTNAQANVNQLTETVIDYKTADATDYDTNVYVPVTNGVQLLVDLENVKVEAGVYVEDNTGQRANVLIAVRIDGVRSPIVAASYIRRAGGANEDTPVVRESYPFLPAGTVITASVVRSGVASNTVNSIENLQALQVFGFVPSSAESLTGIPAPVITSIPDNIVVIDSSKTMLIRGSWFTPDTIVVLSDGTIDNFNVIDDNTIEITVSASSTAGDVDVTISNENGSTTLVAGIIFLDTRGTGVAGTSVTDFGAGFGNWVQSGDVAWTISNAGTPSGNTGPTGPTAPSTGYAYVETSGSFNGTTNAILTTTDFSKLQSVSFDYHMAGTVGQMGDLHLQYSPDQGATWVNVVTISGVQQAAQTDAFLTQNVDFTGLPVTSIRFLYDGFSSFAADASITNVILTSI